jgi:hypothetical protein
MGAIISCADIVRLEKKEAAVLVEARRSSGMAAEGRRSTEQTD